MDCCVTNYGSSVIMRLFLMMQRHAAQLLTCRLLAGGLAGLAWPDSLLDIFIPTVESFHPLQHCSAT